ncbi:unnamed protein product [Rhodiola kirilowii]
MNNTRKQQEEPRHLFSSAPPSILRKSGFNFLKSRRSEVTGL